MTQSRMVQIERDILSKNDAYAQQNRQVLADAGVLALNFVSSPGSGKTTLLCRTIQDLQGRHAVAVIEGDQQTTQRGNQGQPQEPLPGFQRGRPGVGNVFDNVNPNLENAHRPSGQNSHRGGLDQ